MVLERSHQACAGPTWLQAEEDQVGLHRVEVVHIGLVGHGGTNALGAGVVFGQAVYLVLQGVESSGGQHSGLAPPAAKHLAQALGLPDVRLGA